MSDSGYSSKMKVQLYGPAAGISAVFPLGNDFFIFANGSGIYLTGKETISGTTPFEFKYSGLGYNTSAFVAYYIDPAAVTLSVGGRYQYFKLTPDICGAIDVKMDFYGITASATYTFSI